ncbi:MAG: putative 2-aminoethylphosphonate ABC transporter ATP-binding protein [Rhodospirillales bacterium]|jgi:iron(III) transport system ATP-binding protein|nr:putative 2-aminoethylphosphonate ABC transporter ATP-binding protein [Rhodospirillales bacterium]MBT6827204.1 putative 2-aminoethylphosphonate ABC transporter ATP-binding protein [Rhodospirillales bacterium]
MFLKLQNVTKRFGDLVAVKTVSLDIPEGELICFLGPSGCGKTTLLRLIAGLEALDDGDILLNEQDLTQTPDRERNFGMVFQSYSLFPNMTIGNNVAYGLECRKWNSERIKARVTEMLALVHLEDQIDKFPSQLSGGQQQRVALARALAPEPHALLLDEPLSALDAKVRVALRLEIRRLQQSLGITTIMVTHDQEEALTMADRVVIMNEGAIEQVGAPVDVYGDPSTSFVADFIGTMNFLNVTIIDDKMVQLAGRKLACDHWHADALSGQKVRMAIRPEDVRIQAEGPPGDNIVEARIDWIEFLGSTYRIDLTLEGAGEKQNMKTELSAALMRDLDLAIGTKVHALLPREQLWVYP